jgi:hypothetical protein
MIKCKAEEVGFKDTRALELRGMRSRTKLQLKCLMT